MGGRLQLKPGSWLIFLNKHITPVMWLLYLLSVVLNSLIAFLSTFAQGLEAQHGCHHSKDLWWLAQV